MHRTSDAQSTELGVNPEQSGLIPEPHLVGPIHFAPSDLLVLLDTPSFLLGCIGIGMDLRAHGGQDPLQWSQGWPRGSEL